jgi:hypothetical protein
MNTNTQLRPLAAMMMMVVMTMVMAFRIGQGGRGETCQ